MIDFVVLARSWLIASSIWHEIGTSNLPLNMLPYESIIKLIPHHCEGLHEHRGTPFSVLASRPLLSLLPRSRVSFECCETVLNTHNSSGCRSITPATLPPFSSPSIHRNYPLAWMDESVLSIPIAFSVTTKTQVISKPAALQSCLAPPRPPSVIDSAKCRPLDCSPYSIARHERLNALLLFPLCDNSRNVIGRPSQPPHHQSFCICLSQLLVPDSPPTPKWTVT